MGNKTVNQDVMKQMYKSCRGLLGILLLVLFTFLLFFQMTRMTLAIATSNVSLGRKRFQCHMILSLIICVSAGPKIITESLWWWAHYENKRKKGQNTGHVQNNKFAVLQRTQSMHYVNQNRLEKNNIWELQQCIFA